MMTDRDTHFRGFARMLYERLTQNVVCSTHRGLSASERAAFRQEQEQIIAEEAYDLVHASLSAASLQVKEQIDQIMLYVPDPYAEKET